MTNFRMLSFAVMLLLGASACTTERPVVTTDAVSWASQRAFVQSTVSADAPEDVLTSGICFGTAPAPDMAIGTCTMADRGTGIFTDTISGLQNGTPYYVRAYATTPDGTIYGNALTFTPAMGVPGNGVTMDGHDYPTIVLGNGQEWMAENLRTSVYANGDPIPNVTDNSQWRGLTTGAWAHYANFSQYENPYGKLYNWYAVNDPRNVCPVSWHVPSDAEWSTFINYLDPNANGGENENTAGGYMKSTGQYWLSSPNSAATNESGFSGLPGGYRYPSGGYDYVRSHGYWWSSTQVLTSSVWVRSLYYNSAHVYRHSGGKNQGFSVRCLKD